MIRWLPIVWALSGCSLVFGSSHHTGTRDAGMGDSGCIDDGDGDGDGFSECTGDCDDTNADRYPEAPPICDNGVIENCTNDALSTIGTFLDVDELGFHVTRNELQGRPEQLSLALMPGMSASPVAAVVAMTDGTTAEWYTQNLTRLGPLVRGERAQLLGTAAVPRLLSISPAYDFDAFNVLAALVGSADGFSTREFEFEGASGRERSLSVATPGGLVAVVTLPDALGAEASSHLMFSESELIVLPADPASVVVPTRRALYENAPFDVRGTADGTATLQSVLMPSSFVVYVRGDVVSVEDTDVTGALTPLGTTTAGTALLFESAAGVSTALMDCAGTVCDVVPTQIFRSPAGGDIGRVAGALLASDDRTRYAGFLGGFSLRASVGVERVYLVIADPALALVAPPLLLPDFAHGGSILDLEVGAETEAFVFDGVPETQIHVFAVAALIDRGTGPRELAVASLRACQAQ